MFDLLLNHIEKYRSILLWQSNNNHSNNNNQFKKYINIHTKQRSNWDCGIACLSMAAKWSSDCDNDLHNEIIGNELSIRTTPLWTIDLYCFLRDNNINSIMYTRTIGISSTHEELSWYQSHLSDDSNRVANKFQLAKDHGWIIHDVIIDLNIIADNILNGSVAIILVDNYLLHNYNENDDDNDDNDDNYIFHYKLDEEKSNGKIHEYAGHYIFLLEYDPKNKIFTYLDPALNASIVTVSFNVLEKARSHIGTDYDVIIIHRSQIDDTLKTDLH